MKHSNLLELFFVFFDTEWTQDLEKRDGSFERNLIYVLSNCVIKLNPLLILLSIVNSVVSVSTRSARRRR